MEAHTEAMVKSLVAVAWADGRIAGEEHEVLDALLSAFGLVGDDADAIREYAKRERALSDVDLTELSADDRRALLQHAVIVTYVDGKQCERELALLHNLANVLHIPKAESEAILSAAQRRAERLTPLL